jgi:hypothetical protein
MRGGLKAAARDRAARWVEAFAGAGLVRREADPERPGAWLVALSEAGTDAMEDYFVAVQLGWCADEAAELGRFPDG